MIHLSSYVSEVAKTYRESTLQSNFDIPDVNPVLMTRKFVMSKDFVFVIEYISKWEGPQVPPTANLLLSGLNLISDIGYDNFWDLNLVVVKFMIFS